jgi:lipoprotein-releasing system ATP-binding protein
MILQAKNLRKIYKNPTLLTVLADVSLDVAAGESVAILGKSGEGKSTLLHILGGLEEPTDGTLLLCGLSISAYLRNQTIGFIFQAYHLFERLTALDNVLMPLRIARRPMDKEWGLKLLEEVGLLSKADTPAHLLSGGEKQRVAIARAFCNDPALLLADEPTGNLDSASAQMVRELLFGMLKQKGKALVLATHDQELAGLCEQQLSLRSGYLEPQIAPVLKTR